MHGVNLDLLHTTSHHPDGRPRDPHALHRAEHRAALRLARKAWMHVLLSRIVSAAFPFRKAETAETFYVPKYPAGVRGCETPGAGPVNAA